MMWLLRPIFHEGGKISFYRWKQVDRKDSQVIFVHKDVQEFRDFWEGVDSGLEV